MNRIKTIHFIGIGGSGMNGIAEVLLNKGYRITGSDRYESAAVQRLSNLGAEIFLEHNAANVIGTDVVVVSTAIAFDNPEYVAAKKAGIPIIPRAQMLAELMRFNQGIAISGTHGKTTTTSLVASILGEGGLDPTFVIGGLLNSVGANAKLGMSNYFVAEADESDASFLYLNPTISVVTNIDADHMATYDNDFAKLKQTFVDFLHRLPFYGLAILCTDDQIVREVQPKILRPVITYGFTSDADVEALNYKQNGFKSHFTVHNKHYHSKFDVELNLPGRHNVLNALAAIAVASECNVNTDAVLRALACFNGVGRRMQVHGDLNMPQGKVLAIDDYGHHPRELEVTIDAIRKAWPDRRLVLAFQPHRYSRVASLLNEFASVLATADEILLLDIYAAGESPIAGISGEILSQKVSEFGKARSTFVKNLEELPKYLESVVLDNDIVLLQGAGSIGTMPAKLKTIYS